MPSSGLKTARPCSARNASIAAMSRVIRVGAQQSGNQAV